VLIFNFGESPAGYKSGEYARMMGCRRETFNRLLAHLESRGILFSEDQQGRLWPFHGL
jgi:DNA-binding IclR family transcriptional regulator